MIISKEVRIPVSRIRIPQAEKAGKVYLTGGTCLYSDLVKNIKENPGVEFILHEYTVLLDEHEAPKLSTYKNVRALTKINEVQLLPPIKNENQVKYLLDFFDEELKKLGFAGLLKEVSDTLSLNNRILAETCGTSISTIARWKKEITSPHEAFKQVVLKQLRRLLEEATN